jgi:hypothetical protein
MRDVLEVKYSTDDVHYGRDRLLSPGQDVDDLEEESPDTEDLPYYT